MNNSMQNFFEKKYACVEISAILDYLGDEYKNAIPKDVISEIEKNKRKGYNFTIDESKSIFKQSLRQQTIDMIVALYLKYWCKEDKRKKEILQFLKQRDKMVRNENRVYNLQHYTSITDEINRKLNKR